MSGKIKAYITYVPVPEKKHVSISFVLGLYNAGASKTLIRHLLKEIPTIEFFEAPCRGELTCSESAELLQIRRESDYWIVRLFQSLF